MNHFSGNIKLLRMRKKRTQNEVAFELGIKRTTVNAIENEISQPTVKHLQSFSRYFGIAIDTLINTDLKQLSESQFTELQNGFDVYIRGGDLRVIAISVDQNDSDNIEYVNEKAKAGYSTGFADSEYIGKLPVFQLPFLSKEKKYRAFSVSGDSMMPVPDGAIIVGEYIQDFYDIKDSEAYIFVTREEGILFKIATNRLKKNGTLLLSSLNPLYKTFTLSASEIREVWKFASIISREVPEPKGDIQMVLSRIGKLEEKINVMHKTRNNA